MSDRPNPTPAPSETFSAPPTDEDRLRRRLLKLLDDARPGHDTVETLIQAGASLPPEPEPPQERYYIQAVPDGDGVGCYHLHDRRTGRTERLHEGELAERVAALLNADEEGATVPDRDWESLAKTASALVEEAEARVNELEGELEQARENEGHALHRGQAHLRRAEEAEALAESRGRQLLAMSDYDALTARVKELEARLHESEAARSQEFQEGEQLNGEAHAEARHWKARAEEAEAKVRLLEEDHARMAPAPPQSIYLRTELEKAEARVEELEAELAASREAKTVAVTDTLAAATQRDVAVARAEEAERELAEAKADNGDVTWLLGALADAAPEGFMLPPRLVGIVTAARRAYNPSRFTVATPIGQTDPSWLGHDPGCVLDIDHKGDCEIAPDSESLAQVRSDEAQPTDEAQVLATMQAQTDAWSGAIGPVEVTPEAQPAEPLFTGESPQERYYVGHRDDDGLFRVFDRQPGLPIAACYARPTAERIARLLDLDEAHDSRPAPRKVTAEDWDQADDEAARARHDGDKRPYPDRFIDALNAILASKAGA